MADEPLILDDLAFDYAFIARQITDWRAKHGKAAGQTDSLTNAITDVRLADSIVGSSTLEVSISDPQAQFLDYFGVDENGRPDAIDLHYPADDENAWWRMTQMHLSSNPGSAMEYRLTFLERPAVYLMGHRGVYKTSRNAATRAQFIKALVKKVKASGGLGFICHQETRDQVSTTRPVSTPGGGGTKLIYAGDSLGVGTWGFLKGHKHYEDTLHEVKSGRTSRQVLDALTPRLNNKINQVVFDAGSNDHNSTMIDSVLTDLYAATGNRDLILVTVHHVDWAAGINSKLRAFANSHEFVYVADWNSLANDHPEYLAKDQLHATHAGYKRRADLVWGTIQSIPGPSLRSPIIDYITDEVELAEPITGVDVDKEPSPQKAETKRRSKKSPGIRQDADLKVDGIKATKEQIRLANIILDVAAQEHAGVLETEALMVAAIGESKIQEIMEGYFANTHLPPSQRPTNGAGGVFQGAVSRKDIPNHFKLKGDTDKQARAFLLGGKGFQNGGAKSLAKRHPDYTPGNIAGLVEASGKNYPGTGNRHYDKYLREARAFIKAYAYGFDHGTTVTRAQFNFRVAKNETYWDAMQRLAHDVNWRLFVDGRTIFFDSDTVLIQQIPAAYVDRRDPAVLSWQASWDGRRIATQMTLELVCDPFEYRAGEVFVLRDFGMLSEGSTVKLPGRWLITDIDRNSGQVFSSFTLAQPEHEKAEPQADTIERSEDDNDEASEVSKGSALDQVKRDWGANNVIHRVVFPIVKQINKAKGGKDIDLFGFPLTVQGLIDKNAGHNTNTTNGRRSQHAGPAHVAWAADLSNGDHPTSEMDALARALILAFDLPDLADWDATTSKPPNPGNLVGATHGGFKYQLIYRCYTDAYGGNHMDHVHFGVGKL